MNPRKRKYLKQLAAERENATTAPKPVVEKPQAAPVVEKTAPTPTPVKKAAKKADKTKTKTAKKVASKE